MGWGLGLGLEVEMGIMIIPFVSSLSDDFINAVPQALRDGAYSLGANNIANVMGVFVDVSPFTGFSVAGIFELTSVQQLFLIGAVAIKLARQTQTKDGSLLSE